MDKQRVVLLRPIGKGGYGDVFEARYGEPRGPARTVAVKLLSRDLGADPEALGRLREEARVLAALDHPSIVRVHELTDVDGRAALVTELVPGTDLSRHLPLPPGALFTAIGQVADALACAHAARGPDGVPLRLVHRDVKPSNIRVRPDGRAILLDFGVARTAGPREVRTASHRVVGSLPYMAPECFVERRYDGATDVFALGATLFEGLTGHRLYPKGTLRHVSSMALDPRLYQDFLTDRLRAAPDLPRPAHHLLEDSLRHSPERRPTALEAARRCDEIAAALPGPTLAAWYAAAHASSSPAS